MDKAVAIEAYTSAKNKNNSKRMFRGRCISGRHALYGGFHHFVFLFDRQEEKKYSLNNGLVYQLIYFP